MGRRKKEPESVHRDNIAAAAERLFAAKGITATTMDDIAKQAEYSKATLYVYFTNKEEIVGLLVLKSMKMLRAVLHEAVSAPAATKEKYERLCHALAQYQAQYPLYFSLALGEINIDFDKKDHLPVERETFEVGEQINAEIVQFLRSGMEAGALLPDIPVLPTVFLFWASLSGVIQMAAHKRAYIEQAMGQTKEQFLTYGFDRLYRLIAREDKE